MIDEVCQRMGSSMSTDALEMLAVEIAAARHLPVMLDRKPSQRDVVHAQGHRNQRCVINGSADRQGSRKGDCDAPMLRSSLPTGAKGRPANAGHQPVANIRRV
jgi:antitoxin component of RelBE/YafQ-DinJ toxin-antitoxin module